MWIDRAARVEIGRALWWNLGMYNTHRVDMGRLGEEGHRTGAGACTTHIGWMWGGYRGETGGGAEEREGGSEVEWLGLSLMCPVIATERNYISNMEHFDHTPTCS